MAVFLILLPCLIYPQSKVGTTAANFLQIGVGGRGVATGDASTASSRDISGIFWNPALGAFSETHEVYFNHIQWFAGIELNYGSALLAFGGLGNFAATFYSLTTDQIEVTTEDYPNGTGDVYTVQDLMVALSYSRPLTNRFNIGGSAKYIHSQIWNNSASAFAIDVGLTYRLPFDRVNMGLSISNFGTEMHMTGTDNAIRFDPDLRVGGNNDGIVAEQSTGNWDLPILFRFGLAYDMLYTPTHQVMLMSDVLYPGSNENYVNAGVEYGFMDIFFLRGGFRQIFLKNREGGLTLGAGFKLYNIHLDYAYGDRQRLNEVQYFSVAIRF